MSRSRRDVVRVRLRSLAPIIAIVTVVVLTAVLVGRPPAGPVTPAAWTPPPGYERVATLSLADGTGADLWIDLRDGTKPGDCWELVRTLTGGGSASVGACGRTAGQPWVHRWADVVAGGTGERVAGWVTLDGGDLIAVSRGHFLAPTTLPEEDVSVRLLRADGHHLATFPQVPVGGTA